MIQGCDFVAIDVETANSRRSSICQIGLAKYIDGELKEELSLFINPEEYFDPINIRLHGISSTDVENSPTFPEVFTILEHYLNNIVCVCHTNFDREAINQAINKYGLANFTSIWLDTALIARRSWEEFSTRGYGLENICRKIGYEFNHHDALDDAKASAQIFMAAIQSTGINLSAWIKHQYRPINPTISMGSTSIKRDGNQNGPLFGEILVFTGELELPRFDAADLAASIGCSVRTGVTKKTTILVVGDLCLDDTGNVIKTGKYKEAEDLINKGQNIRILNENNFIDLLLQSRKQMRE